MINTNALLLCDTYKCCHRAMYPKGLTNLTSYWVPRKSMFEKPENQKMVFFGLQAFIQEFLIDYFNDNFFRVPLNDILDSYKRYLNIQVGEGNYDLKSIEDLHRLSYLPIEIHALPEGSLVNMGVPCIEVTNTRNDFAWVVQWIECIMQAELWKTCNHAIIGHMYYTMAKKWYKKNSDNDLDPRNAFSDFGMRGMSCVNGAIRCSASWLLSSNKTSTIAALPYLDKYYDADCSFNHIGVGAVSTEHSVMASNYAVDGDEITFVKRLLTELYPNTSFSMVSDTYDYWNMVNNILPECKQEIMSHNGKLLVRPDSGDVKYNVIETIKKLWNTFGGSWNSKGYKVLDPHIGIILGEGATLNVINKIWDELDSLKFAASNVIFGVGVFCFTAVFENNKMIVNTRDTFGCAMKSCYGIVDDKEIMIYKDPKTDKDNLKKSHKGLVFVWKEGSYYKYKDGLTAKEFNFFKQQHNDAMHLVFKSGFMYNKETFTQIRTRLENE